MLPVNYAGDGYPEENGVGMNSMPAEGKQSIIYMMKGLNL